MTAPITGVASSPRVRTQSPLVRAGVIGCGDFGTGIVAQAASAPLLEIVAAADHRIDAARQAYRRAGIPDERIRLCESRAAALRVLERGNRVVVADPLLLMDLPLDVIVEATGHPESGALYAEVAIHHGRHVAMVNKEADVCVGPFLKHLADQAGVVYTAVDGDQHGLLIGLVAWARRLGMEVLCGGKARDQEFVCDPVAQTLSSGSQPVQLTAKEYLPFRPLTPEPTTITGGARERHLKRRRVQMGERGRIGGWDLVELVITANGTGLVPDLPTGVHCPALYTSEIPGVLCPTEMGGILRARGAIDAVTCLRQPHETGLSGGVFVVVTVDNDVARDVLRGGSVWTNADGSAALLTRPFHLVGVEAIHSILAAASGGVSAGAMEYRPRFDVLARGARDLDAGTLLGNDHSAEIEAFIGPATPLSSGHPLPLHLANGNRLTRAIDRGTVITKEMVEAPADSALWSLRARQDDHFLCGARV